MGNFALTDKQKAAMSALSTGPGLMPIIHFGRLRDLGLVEKAEGTAGQRGYSYAQLTSAGAQAIA